MPKSAYTVGTEIPASAATARTVAPLGEAAVKKDPGRGLGAARAGAASPGIPGERTGSDTAARTRKPHQRVFTMV